jgi:hypothetical protein
MDVAVRRRLFTTDEYHRLGAAGILGEDDRVELLEGVVVEMTPIGRLHAAVVDRANALFTARLGPRAIVRVQSPVPAGPLSEPQPDLALLRRTPDYYATSPLTPADVLLVLEVADTSLAHDRAKVRVYAAAGIPEVWIVDLAGERLEVYRRPAGGRYTDERVVQRGERSAPEAFADLSLTLDDLIGPRAA